MNQLILSNLTNRNLRARTQVVGYGFRWDCFWFKTKMVVFALSEYGEPSFQNTIYRSKLSEQGKKYFDLHYLQYFLDEMVENNIFDPHFDYQP